MEMVEIVNIIKNNEVKLDPNFCGLKFMALEFMIGLCNSLSCSGCFLQCFKQNLSQNPMIPEVANAFSRELKSFLNNYVPLMVQE
jgi:hypothetical protein